VKKGYIYEQDEVIIALSYQSEPEKGLPSTATHTQGQVRIALLDQNDERRGLPSTVMHTQDHRLGIKNI